MNHKALITQLKNSTLTVKYSEANGNELACIWEDNSDAESLLVINRIKINGIKLNQHVPDDRENLVNLFFNPKNSEKSMYDRLMDIVEEKYEILVPFVHSKRGQTAGKKFGF
jgi:hypothetical protein